VRRVESRIELIADRGCRLHVAPHQRSGTVDEPSLRVFRARAREASQRRYRTSGGSKLQEATIER
jgi:hypothetical protein